MKRFLRQLLPADYLPRLAARRARSINFGVVARPGTRINPIRKE